MKKRKRRKGLKLKKSRKNAKLVIRQDLPRSDQNLDFDQDDNEEDHDGSKRNMSKKAGRPFKNYGVDHEEIKEWEEEDKNAREDNVPLKRAIFRAFVKIIKKKFAFPANFAIKNNFDEQEIQECRRIVDQIKSVRTGTPLFQ